MTRKTIQVSDTTYQRLMEYKADLIHTHGQNFSMDEVINEIADTLEAFVETLEQKFKEEQDLDIFGKIKR